MPTINFLDRNYECNANETVLECMQRHNVAIPSSCRAGVCQSCIMKVTNGNVPIESQAGLKPTQVQRGYFLPCVCKPTENIQIDRPGRDAITKYPAKLIEKSPLSEKIIRLRFNTPAGFGFRAGQFIDLHRADGLVRSYSIASLPNERMIELHVEIIDNGKMSQWLRDEFQIDDVIDISGPYGECFYVNDNPEQKLLLIGTGSGLAPLWGIARDALFQGHKGEIHFFHGSRSSDKIYLVEELKHLADDFNQFSYTGCLSREESEGFVHGRADAVALEQFAKLDGWRIYLCGHPDMVNNTKKKAFLAGASFKDIFADAFTH